MTPSTNSGSFRAAQQLPGQGTTASARLLPRSSPAGAGAAQLFDRGGPGTRPPRPMGAPSRGGPPGDTHACTQRGGSPARCRAGTARRPPGRDRTGGKAAARSKFPAGPAPPSPPGGGNFWLGLCMFPPARRSRPGPWSRGQRRPRPGPGRGRPRRQPPRGEGSSCPARRKSRPRVTAATKEK